MSKEKTINLTISERLYALRILNDFKGSLEKLSVVLEDIKQFTVKEDEWLKAEKKETKDDEAKTVQWTWDDDFKKINYIDWRSY